MQVKIVNFIIEIWYQKIHYDLKPFQIALYPEWLDVESNPLSLQTRH